MTSNSRPGDKPLSARPASQTGIVVVGGGLVGLGTAYALHRQDPMLKITLLEKEAELGRHQSSHNSGVLHCGLYYKPGSSKAKLAVSGIRKMVSFCKEFGIDHEICGKIVLATNDVDVERLRELQRRGESNGLSGIKWLGEAEIREREPHAKGPAALLVPEEGIVDFSGVIASLREQLLKADVEMISSAEVRKIRKDGAKQTVEWDGGSCSTDFVVNCAGLHSDRVARAAGLTPSCKIIPFRGEYFKLSEEGQRLVKHLIYPTPDPAFPFLGVHFSRLISGGIEAGPNAVLAMAREGYRKTDVNFKDLFETLTFGGFQRFLLRYPGSAIQELGNSLFKSVFLSNLRQLVPAIRKEDLLSTGGAGVRAQAIGRDGKLVDDFFFEEAPGQLHVLNAPSPGATASLAIGEHVANRVVASL